MSAVLSWADNVCRCGRGRPKPAVLITSMPLYVAAEPSFAVGCSHAGLAAVKSLLKAPRCSHDAGAVRLQHPNNSEHNRLKVKLRNRKIEAPAKASQHASIIEAKAAGAFEQPTRAGQGSTMPWS